MSGFPTYDENQPPFNLKDFVQTLNCLTNINRQTRSEILNRIIFSPTPYYTMLSTLCYYNCRSERLGSDLFDETDVQFLNKTNLFKKFKNFNVLTSIILSDDAECYGPITKSMKQTDELPIPKDSKLEIQKHLPYNVSYEEFLIAAIKLKKIEYNPKYFKPEILTNSEIKRLYYSINNPIMNGIIVQQRTERYIKLKFPIGRPIQSGRSKMDKSVLNDDWKLFQGSTKPHYTEVKRLSQIQLQERQIEEKITELECSINGCRKLLRELILTSAYKPYYFICLNNQVETEAICGKYGYLLFKFVEEIKRRYKKHPIIQITEKMFMYWIHERFINLHLRKLAEMNKYKSILSTKGAFLIDKINISPVSVPKPIVYTNIGCPDHIIVENLSFVSQFMIFRQECIPRSSLLKFNKILSILRLDKYSSKLSVEDAKVFLLIISLTVVFDYFHPNENDRSNMAFVTFSKFINLFTEIIIPSVDFCKLKINLSDVEDLVNITNGMSMKNMYDIIYFTQYLILCLIQLNQGNVSKIQNVWFEKDGERIVMNDIETQEPFFCQFDPNNTVEIDESS